MSRAGHLNLTDSGTVDAERDAGSDQAAAEYTSGLFWAQSSSAKPLRAEFDLSLPRHLEARTIPAVKLISVLTSEDTP